MFEFFEKLFSTDFMPHGHCMMWEPAVLWLHIVSDILITLSYYSIPIALIYLIKKRKDLQFNWIFLMFAVFILACGTNHIIDVWTLWNPVYRFEGIMKFVTACASVATAIVIWPLIPKIINLPSPSQLEQANRELQEQARQREKAELELRVAYENLERLVDKRTEELRKANIALIESEQRYHKLYESAPDMFASVDPSTQQIVQCNETLSTKLNYEKDEIIGKSIYSLYHPDCIEKAKSTFEVFKQTGELKLADLEVQSKSGVRIPVRVNISAIKNDQGEILYSNTILRDITELEQAQRVLRQNEERLRVMLESLPNALVLVDDAGRIELMNIKAEQYFGYQKEEVTGKDIEVLIPQRFERKHKKYFSAYWQHPTPRAMGESRDLFARKKDGSEFPVEVGLTPCRINQKTFIISSIIDITERKQAEEKLQRQSEELAHSYSELEQFAYVASHDLRAPLRHMVGFAKALQKHLGDDIDDIGAEYTTDIIESGKQMGQLIDKLLEYSRTGRSEFQKGLVNMDQLVQDVLKELHPETEGRVIKWELDTLPDVHADYHTLKLVWQNLLANAIKYTEPRDSAHIKVSTEKSDGSQIVFYIQDNGVGFEMQYGDKLFGIFQRLHHKDEFEGTGIGLANVARIVHRHNGRVWAKGKVGDGATFYFSLPTI